MPDIPKYKTSKVAAKLDEYLTAAEAVREGIATHVEKHRAAQHAKRQALEQARKLQAGKG